MIICFAVFLLAAVVCLITGHSLVWALLAGLALFFGLGLRRGYSAPALGKMAWAKGRESLVVIPVFLMIGMVMGLWRASGTISFFLYHGLRLVAPSTFVLVAFLLSALLSFALGTCYGVTGTAGVVLIALARAGGVPVPVAAGAILSGAYFGDRCSPMSSCATLVAACTGTELYRNVREMLKTAALPTALAVVFYAVLSARHPIAAVDGAVLDALTSGFSLSWPTALPAALMLALPLCRVKVKWAMALSALTAFGLAVLLQGQSPMEALASALTGYAPADPDLAAVLSGGGLTSMLSSSAVVLITSLYAGILEGMDALVPLEARAERLAARLGLFPAMAVVCTGVGLVFCNQTVMAMMGEQLLRPSYARRGASRTQMAMDIANSGVTLAGLIPWSIAISVPLSMLNATYAAVPYAVLLYFIPICYGFTRRFFAAAQRRVDPYEKEEAL